MDISKFVGMIGRKQFAELFCSISAEQWNKLRKKIPSNERANFFAKFHHSVECNFANMCFADIDFSACYFGACDLTNADCRRAIFDKSTFFISRHHLSDTDLRGTSFRDADCPGAEFMWTKSLADADFSRAVLKSVKFGNFDDFQNVPDVTGLCLIDADCEASVFANLDLRSIKFSHSTRFVRARFNMANLTGLNLEGHDLSGASFQDANCSGVNFRNCNLQGALFHRAILTDACFEGANVGGVKGLRD